MDRDLRRLAPDWDAAIQGRVILECSTPVDALMTALAKAKLRFPYGKVRKSRTAKMDRYSYDYEALSDLIEAIDPILAEEGVVLLQAPYVSGQGVVVRSMLAHVSGQYIASDLTLPNMVNDPHALGSQITYAMRYARRALLGYVAVDDDDDAASARAAIMERTESVATPPEPETIHLTERVQQVTTRGDGTAVVLFANGLRVGTRVPDLATVAQDLVEKTARAVIVPSRRPGFMGKLVSLEEVTP